MQFYLWEKWKAYVREAQTHSQRSWLFAFFFLQLSKDARYKQRQTDGDDEDEYNDFSHFHLLSCSGQLHLNVIEWQPNFACTLAPAHKVWPIFTLKYYQIYLLDNPKVSFSLMIWNDMEIECGRSYLVSMKFCPFHWVRGGEKCDGFGRCYCRLHIRFIRSISIEQWENFGKLKMIRILSNPYKYGEEKERQRLKFIATKMPWNRLHTFYWFTAHNDSILLDGILSSDAICNFIVYFWVWLLSAQLSHSILECSNINIVQIYGRLYLSSNCMYLRPGLPPHYCYYYYL